MKLRFSTLVLFTLLSTSAYSNDAFEQLLEEIWQYQLKVNPISATSYGVHDYDAKLQDVSKEQLKKQNDQYLNFLEQLSQIDPKTLKRSEQITLQIQLRQIQNLVDQYQFNAHFVPLTAESGFYSNIAFLPSRHPFDSISDYQNYLKRLEAIPTLFEQHINWMKKGLESGMTLPKVSLQGMPDSIAAFYQIEVNQSPFYGPFRQLGKLQLSEEQQSKLFTEAEKVIKSSVFNAYKNFHEFLVAEYIPNAKDDVAVISWPNGKDYYQNRVAYYTTTNMTADEIHNLGLTEVKRIREEMGEVIKQANFEGNLKDFIHFLRTDPQFYARSEQEIMRYAAYLSKKMDSQLPKLFSYLPRTPYGVAPVPANIAPKYTTGRYIPPGNDKEPGYYWVNTYGLDKRPLYALPALTLHEAVPGHHLQIALSRELEGLPPVRRFTYISAFGEGWGLYSEYLGVEVGMYETPYDEFGRLSYEMWRAARLVVDTGMHTKGWSRQKALNFMLDNTALSEHNVTTEIDRYITWPAQALSYKIGELTIKRLRQEAVQQLGDKFDIREFHRAVLAHGSVPLSVLEDNIAEYVRKVSSTKD